MRAENLFWGEQVNITAPNYMVFLPTILYQYLLLDLLHASNNNLIILI